MTFHRSHPLEAAVPPTSSLGTKHLLNSALIDASIVWLDMCTDDLSAVNNESIALAAHVSEQGRGVEVEAEGFCECARGVGDEVDLISALSAEGFNCPK